MMHAYAEYREGMPPATRREGMPLATHRVRRDQPEAILPRSFAGHQLNCIRLE